MRVAYFTIVGLCIALLLAGCQSQPTVNRVVDTYKILQSKTQRETAYLSCSASIYCYFARVDDIVILNEKTKRPTPKAIEQGLLRLEGSLFAVQNQYALSLLDGSHEIVVWFYPVSDERVEAFHFIHAFKAGHNYKVVMYRQKSTTNGSLLQMAAPGDLCVDLLQDDNVVRRFCRAYNVMNGGMGEFLEKRI